MKKLFKISKRTYSSISKIFMLIIISVSTLSMEVFAAEAPKVDSTNPYVRKAIDIFKELEGYMLAIIGVITVVKVIQYSIQYQGGSDDEKAQAIKLIRKTLIMGAGIFFLIWLAGYVFDQFSKVQPT